MPRAAKTLMQAVRGDVRSFPIRVRGVLELANGPRCRAVRDLLDHSWDERVRRSQTCNGCRYPGAPRPNAKKRGHEIAWINCGGGLSRI